VYEWTEDLPPGWYWQANPRDGWLIGSDGSNFELAAVGDDTINLREIPHVLAQRMPGKPCELTVRLEVIGDEASVDLRIVIDRDLVARFAWRLDGEDWREIATPFPVAPGFWTGADLGIFAVSPMGTENLPVASFTNLALSETGGVPA
jgi:hypothetical protein